MRKLTLIILTMLLLCAVSSFAAIPRLINYQGRLLDSQGRPLADGKYKITFKIYDSSGNPIWTELHDPAQGTGIQIEKGIFNVMLGGVTPLNLTFEQQYSLGIQVGSDAEMTPRQLLASSAYAIRANVADEALQAQNAAKVNNIEASTSPQANKLLPLDGNAKFPASTLGLKVYDSGWFPVTVGNVYQKTHNLGTTKVLASLWFSESPSGANAHQVGGSFVEVDQDGRGSYSPGLTLLTSTTITAAPAIGYFSSVYNGVTGTGSGQRYNSGYYRIMMLALE